MHRYRIGPVNRTLLELELPDWKKPNSIATLKLELRVYWKQTLYLPSIHETQTVNTVDDIFDSSLNLEDTHYKRYSEGYTDGLNSGKDEGNQKSIKQMDELLRKYPFSDPENESATDTIDSLRLKFRTICVTLNIRLEYDGYSKASGIDNSGF
ncbi:hypothetical protein BC332_25386 [Capsicum chinense]|nr:hypothetical protein BC332_25386 [Capsicum chinense]